MKNIDHLFQRADEIHSLAVLNEFFDYYGIYHARNYIDKLLENATAGKYFKDKKTAGEMMFLGEWLQKIVPAVHILYKECRFVDLFEATLLENGNPDLDRRDDYMWYPTAANSWKNVPRYLTAEEYAKPVPVLAELHRYKSSEKWKRIIYELLDYSVSCNSIDEEYAGFNILKLRKKLMRCLEATYLVLVRYQREKKKPAENPMPVSSENISNEADETGDE